MYGLMLKRIICNISAAVLAVSNILPLTTDIVGQDVTVNINSGILKQQSLEVCPDDDTVVTLDGLMPKNASVSAVDVTEIIADSDILASPTSLDNSVIVAYDITINDGIKEYQPDENRPIYVEITNPDIYNLDSAELWHISDDGQCDIISDFTLEDGKICFEATGFSVYALVDGPSPIPGNSNVTSLDQLEGNSFVIHNDKAGSAPNYLTNTLTNASGGRIITTSSKDSATNFYFSKIDGTENVYSVYYLNEENQRIYLCTKKDRTENFYFKTNTDNTYISEFRIKKSEFGDAFYISSETDKVGDDKQNYWYYDKSSNNKNVKRTRCFVNGDYNKDKNQFETKTETDDKEKLFLISFNEPIDPDPFKLDGKTYNLLSISNGPYAKALMSKSNDTSSLSYIDAYSYSNPLNHKGINLVVDDEDDDLSQWTFHWEYNDYYSLSTDVNGTTKYLKIDGTSLTLSDTKSQLQILPNSDGYFKLSSAGSSISYNNKYNYFSAKSEDKENKISLFALAESSSLTSDDFVIYKADKIGVSDERIVTGKKVIVYTRIWHESEKQYRFYAINSDGTLVECYERGDKIMWIGNRFNTMLWEFTEYFGSDGKVNNYYELQNTYSGKYLAPQIGGQVLSDRTIGLNMVGRQNGEYYSPILAWDDPHYAYAGLTAQESSDSCILKTGSKAKAFDFYFAIIPDDSNDNSTIDNPLHTVETIDNDDYGIIMKMVDFGTRDDMTSFLIDNNTDNKIRQGLLSNHLYNSETGTIYNDDNEKEYNTNGYPMIAKNTNSQTLGDMYSSVTSENKREREVNNLFIKSTYEATGYFEFDSCQNFATLKDKDGNFNTRTVDLGNGKTKEVIDFTVYEEIATSNSDGRTTLKHGQFFPYDTIDLSPNYTINNPKNLYSALALYGDGNENIGILPESDPRKYEKLYSIGKSPNYQNGMEIEAGFVQTPNGKDSWGHDIIFEFTGDDDFWLYVDGELVIDLGGIHSALAGSVNFSTGDVYVNGEHTTLKALFLKNCLDRGDELEKAQQYVDSLFTLNDEGNYVFNDYSKHTMRIFYMERGGGASNLHMRFNLSYVTPGNVILKKEVTGLDELNDEFDTSLVKYPFQIYYSDSENPTDQGTLLSDIDEDGKKLVRITYQNSTQTVDWQESYTPPGSNTTFDSVYFLNPDQVAEIEFPSDTMKYRIVECGINTEVYNSVSLKGEVNALTEEPIPGTNRACYITTNWRSVKELTSVVFQNHVNEEGLRSLSITKNLLDENGNLVTPEDDDTTFTYRLYLTNGFDDKLTLASMAKYRVLMPFPLDSPNPSTYYYCTWDSENQKFVSTGKTNISEFDDKESITFETSINGTISKIPTLYKVEIPNLPIGTKFQIIERTNDTEIGYGKVEYRREEGTYTTTGENDQQNIGRINWNESPRMTVINRRGYGLEVTKKWSDDDYVFDHSAIYTAVYVGDNKEPLPGSVRKIEAPNSRIRYFFPELDDDALSLNDYNVFEVTLTSDGNIICDDDFVVDDNSYTSIHKANQLLITAKEKVNGTYPKEAEDKYFQYDPSYIRGEAMPLKNDKATGQVKYDTIKNNRQGGIVISLYDMDTKEPLSSGKFELYDSSGKIGSFTSDSSGQITILIEKYNLTIGEEYTLKEIEAPNGYVGIPKIIKFKITENTDPITGEKEYDAVASFADDTTSTEWYEAHTVSSNPENLIARINIYNRPYSLKVIKWDSDHKCPLADAHFALYKGDSEVKNGKTVYFKDYHPIDGFNDIVSRGDGLLQSVNDSLNHGIYFLVETKAPDNCDSLDFDVVIILSPNGDVNAFTVSSDGSVTTDNHISFDTSDERNLLIKVPNRNNDTTPGTVELTLLKEVKGSLGNRAEEFNFTFSLENLGAVDKTLYTWYINDIEQVEKIASGHTFKMKHGDTIRIIGLPKYSVATITEEDTNYNTVYTVGTKEYNDNSIIQTLINDTSIKCINSLNGILPTGLPVDPVLALVGVFGLLNCGAFIAKLRESKLRKEE